MFKPNSAPNSKVKRACQMMAELATQNAKAGRAVDELVNQECERLETGDSLESPEFDRTAELFAINSLIIGEPDQS